MSLESSLRNSDAANLIIAHAMDRIRRLTHRGRDPYDASLTDALDFVSYAQLICAEADGIKEEIQAFMEKRAPRLRAAEPDN